MALIVQKFGGTSVGSLERIKHVADIIIRSKAQGHQIVVVVSAMSGETDRLIELAKTIQHQPEEREYAALLSTGEQVSMALLTMVLASKGCPARSYTGIQAGIKTDNSYKSARILNINSQNILEYISQGGVAVVAGFQGYTENGDITTLGRGGSDTTAVALSASLQAHECHIYTDVDGVYTADPRVVPEARLLSQITFEEMLELSSLGAKVLQIRSVEFAGKYNVPLRVLSSFNDGPGTLISSEEKAMEEPIISGVAYTRHEAKVTILGVPDIPGVAYSILGPIGDRGIEVDMIVQNVAEDGLTNFTFTVHRDDYEQTVSLLEVQAVQLGARKIIGDTKIAKLSVVGVGMRSHAAIASKMFKALATEGINIQMITTSEIKVSVVVDEKYIELGTRTLHAAFNLDKHPNEEQYR
jgi:aspartate kinase